MAERQTTVANPNLDPFPTGWGSALVGSRACFRGSVLFCTRFVYRISCRDPRPYPSLNPNPNLNLNPDPLPQAGERCAVCGRTLGLCAPFCFILHPLRLPHQLPRSATATPAAVTPQHQTPDRTLLQNTIMRTFCFLLPAASSQQQQASNGCRDPRPQRQRLSRPNAQRSNVRRPWLPHSRRHCDCRSRASGGTSCLFILAHVSSTASVAAIRGRNVNGRHDRTPNDRTQDPRQLWFSVRIVLQFLFWRPLRQPHQLPRSAAATPTAVHAFCHVCRNGVGRPTLARAHWLSYQTAATATAVRLYLMNNSEA